MSLFSSDNRGDRGPHYVPHPSGLCRLWTIFTRDTPGLLGAGLLATFSSLIYSAGLFLSIDSHSLLPMLIGCPLGGLIASPQLCGMSDTVLRSLRDEEEGWWKTYRRAWRQNVKGSLLPGALGGLLFGFQAFILAQVGRIHLDLFLLLAMLLGVAASTAITIWLLPQLVLMELPLHRALLNAMLLCARHPLKTLGATVIQLLYWGAVILALPYSLAFFVLLNFWLPVLCSTMVIYDSLDETFHIEESLYGEPDND